MEYNVKFQDLSTTCNEQIKIIGISITSNICHFFVLGAFKILSTSYFEINSSLCQPQLSSCAIEAVMRFCTPLRLSFSHMFLAFP